MHFRQKQWFEFKKVSIMDLFRTKMQLYISNELIVWNHVDYCDVFIWWHPFTAEDPLVSKWCNAKFLQICSHEETNSSTSWMAWGWVHFQQTLRLSDPWQLQINVRQKHCSNKHHSITLKWTTHLPAEGAVILDLLFAGPVYSKSFNWSLLILVITPHEF